jgi:hypothetical protein
LYLLHVAEEFLHWCQQDGGYILCLWVTFSIYMVMAKFDALKRENLIYLT